MRLGSTRPTSTIRKSAFSPMVGVAPLPRADTIPPGNAYINPITEIRLTRWRASGAHIRLSDHRYR